MTTKARQGTIKIGYIGHLEITYMLIFLLSTKIFLTFPAFVIESAGSSAWISIIISAILGTAGIAGWLLWINDTSCLGFVPGLRKTAGRILGDLTAFFLLAYFLIKISMNTRIFGGGAVIGLLPRFPIEVLLATIIIPSIYTAWLGIEPIARMAVLLIPLIGISLAIVLLASYHLFDLRHLLPIWGLGPKETILTGLANVRLWGSIPVIIVLKSYVRNKQQYNRAILKGIAISGIILTVITVAVISIFPYPQSTYQVIPLGIIARSARLALFFERIEALFAFTWFFAIALQSSIVYIVIFIVFAQLTNTKTYRPIVPAVALLVFGLSALPADIHTSATIFTSPIFTIVEALTLALGWILFAVERIRKKIIGHSV